MASDSYGRGLITGWVADVLSDCWRPMPTEEPWEWAERTLRIPPTENEELGGQYWSSAYSPYVREMMEFVRSPGKGEFWIEKSSQVGFTMAILIVICWMIACRPGNVGYGINSREEARNISKVRLKQWIEYNDLLPGGSGPKEELNSLVYFLRNMTVYMLGAHGEGEWANKSLVLAVLDELDKHPISETEGTTADQARERVRRPRNSKVIGFSTPGGTGQITLERKSGTDERVHVPCPHCGTYQSLEWEQFVFTGDEFLEDEPEVGKARRIDRRKVLELAHFACINAEGGDWRKKRREAGLPLEAPCPVGRIVESEKASLLQKYRYVPTNKMSDPRRRSVRIWDAYSQFCTWGELARDWLDAQGSPAKLRRYVQGRRAEAFEHRGAGGELRKRDVLRWAGNYGRGTLPFEPALVTMQVDIQAEVLKWAKTAWTLSGDLWVVDWGTLLAMDEVEQVADDEIAIVDKDGDVVSAVDVQCGVIDDGHKSKEVRRFCYRSANRFWPVKGRGGVQVRQHIAVTDADVHLEEDVVEIDLYLVDDDGYKWQLRNLLRPPRQREKEKDIAPVRQIHFPREITGEAGRDLVAELLAEYPVKELDKLGQEKWKWHKKKDQPNDWFDCLKYALPVWDVMLPSVRALAQAAREVKHAEPAA